jgi:diamine N-acetyltransferase
MLGIREVTIDEIPALRDLVFRVWPQTYENLLSPDQITYMLDLMYSESSLKQQMEEGARFIIIDNNQEPVGYASFQPTGPSKFKLQKLYVLPDQQGKGTGRLMVEYIITQIKKKGATILELQVKRDNKARYFYEKLGFEIIRSQVFDIGHGYVMDDYIMEKKI